MLFLRSHHLLSIKSSPAGNLKREANRFTAIILGSGANRSFGARWRDHLGHYRDPELDCPETPAFLAGVDEGSAATASDEQRETGTPFFLALVRQELMARESALDLMLQYGQKLFSQLWAAPRVWITFEKNADLLTNFADLPGEPNVRDWALQITPC